MGETLQEKILTVGDRIGSGDSNAQFAVVHDLAKAIAHEFNDAELFPFVEALIAGLNDPEPASASGTCIIMNGILRIRGAELSAHVPAIVKGVHSAMKTIKNDQTLNGTLHSLRTLTAHHLLLVADEILAMDLPHDPCVIRLSHPWCFLLLGRSDRRCRQAVKFVHTLAKDAKIGKPLMTHLMELLMNMQPYAEKPGKKKNEYVKEATKVSMAATCTLGEMFEVDEIEETVREQLASMMATLLMRLGATNGIEKANAFNRDVSADALATFNKFLTRIKDEDVVAALDTNGNSARLAGEEFHSALTDLAEYAIVLLLFRSFSFSSHAIALLL